MPAGDHLGAATLQRERRAVVDPHFESGRLAVEGDRAVNALERRVQLDGLADGELRRRLERPEPRQLDHHLRLAGGQRQHDGSLTARAQVLAVDVHHRAGRLALHAQQRQRGLQPLHRRRQLLAVRLGHVVSQDLGVPAVRLVVALQLLERARDVEDDVAVAHQAVRGEELAQRLLHLALPVEVGGAVEAEIRLVGNGVGARGKACQEQRRRRRESHVGYRSALMPSSGADFFVSIRLSGLKLNSSPSLATAILPCSWW